LRVEKVANMIIEKIAAQKSLAKTLALALGLALPSSALAQFEARMTSPLLVAPAAGPAAASISGMQAISLSVPSAALSLRALAAAPFAASFAPAALSAPAAPAALQAAAAASASPTAAPAAAAPAGAANTVSAKIASIGRDIEGAVQAIGAGGSSLENVARSGGDIMSRMLGETVAGAGAVAGPAASEPARTKGGALLPEEENSIKVFETAAPSVVFITNLQVGHDRYGYGYGAEEQEAQPHGQGSGYVWDKDGHIVTNYHVVKGGDGFLVAFKDGIKLKATLVGSDPSHDIAVLKITGAAGKLTPIAVGDSDALRVGQKTIAIGNPFGLSHTMTTGIVSALGREVQGIGGNSIRKVIQTDASINPGNSGGPLLDSGARLIGMNTIKVGTDGIGFAVPVNTIKQIVPELIKNGSIERAEIGIAVFTEEEKARSGIDTPGVVVRQALPGSPAEQAGLQGLRRTERGAALGDVIVSVDGKAIEKFDDLFQALEKKKPGDSVTLGIRRGRQEGEISVRLGSHRNSEASQQAEDRGVTTISNRLR
jgi:S1-C subfamily serine protease